MIKSFPISVQRELGLYVYMYSDPDTHVPFYVGVGRGNRAFAHLKEVTESPKTVRIRTLIKAGKSPRIDIVVHGIKDAKTALKIEAALIDVLGLHNLTKKVRGWETRKFGRMEAAALAAYYENIPARIVHPVVLIRITQLFRPDMQPQELYDATRSAWKLDVNRARRAKYAFSVFGGVVQEVYSIAEWVPAGSTWATRDDTDVPGRWEFVGRIGEDLVRLMYVNKRVDVRGQNPISYAGV